ncbi:MAG: radical SAM protein, partial [Chloroflexi bacterium]|nr:radical SAM protein [Chloroflexota bacterium]
MARGAPAASLAARPETYLKVRGVPAFDKVFRNLRMLMETKRRLGSETPRVSLWFTGLRENLPELPDLVRLAAQTGVKEVYLQRLVYWGKGLAQEEQAIFASPTAEERDIVRECDRLGQELGVRFNGSGAMSPLDYFDEPASAAEERPWSGCGRPWR